LASAAVALPEVTEHNFLKERIMKNYSLIAAVVATALASAAAQAQTAPSLATVNSSTAASLVIAGSSAAQPAVFSFIENTMCDNGPTSALVVESTGNTNFFSISCVTSQVTGIPASSLVTVYYRTEGGSVVGALPLVTGYKPFRLNLNACTQPGGTGTVTCSVSGTSSAGTSTTANGPFDSWGGATVQDAVQLGVTDVEPGQLTGKDFPSNYSAAVWGYNSTTASQFAGLTEVPFLQQVFGLAVNIPAADLNSKNNGAVNLSRDSAAAIFNGKLSNWDLVPDALTGNPITSVSLPIVTINREPGSGTRTATNIFVFNYQCGGTGNITAGNTSLNYSTGDDLTAAVAATGSITYAAINNLEPYGTKFSTLTMATINGVTPSNLAAATGQYDFWYEATLVPTTAAISAGSSALSTYIQTAIVDLQNAPVVADVNVITGAGTNVAAIPFTTTGGAGASQVTSAGVSIYVNPFTRGGNSCTVPKTTL
jgi:ABC-type phosphate transport system substrate-binding protein